MRGRIDPTRRFAAALLLALLLLLTPSAHAITRTQATAAALKQLPAARGSTALFALPRPLAAGTHVGAFAGRTAERRSRPLRRRAWLFWQDRGFGAQFAHPSVLLALDADTGRVVLRRRLTFWPLVGGRPAAFVATERAYLGSRFRVDGRRGATRAGPAARAAQARAVTKDDLAGECLVSLGDRRSRAPSDAGGGLVFSGSIDAMQAWARGVGMDQAEAPTAAALASTVDARIAAGCKDVFIYLTGHGRPPGGKVKYSVDRAGNVVTEELDAEEPGVWTDIHVAQATGRGKNFRVEGESVTPADLSRILDRHPSIDFKVKIDSCYSGRFWEPLTGNPWTGPQTRPARHPNLRVLEVSSAPDEVSYAFLPQGQALRRPEDGRVDRYPGLDEAHNPHRATFFTLANVKGLGEWARNPGAVEERPGAQVDRPDFPRGLAGSFNAGAAHDVARRYGLTTPRRLLTPPRQSAPPAQPPPGPPGQPQPVSFSVAIDATYRHLGPGASEVCFAVKTSPARPDAPAVASVKRPDGATARVEGRTDAQGAVLLRMPISQYGRYDATVEVTAADGGRATGTGSVTVTEAQGTCP